jgi:hypothetical protein
MTALIQNLAGVGSCEACDDTGLTCGPALVIDGRMYPHWAVPYVLCERGLAQRRRIASMRVSWRYVESGVAA